MTETSPLLLGGVYLTKWDDRPFRVLAFDEFEVFYDCYWPSIDKWTFGNLRSKGYYYRMTLQRFLEDVKFIREQPLTVQELQTFRPELPFRVCRNKFLAWTDQQFSDTKVYSDFINLKGANVTKEIVLPVHKIVLHPYGPKSGAVKPSVIFSKKEGGFSCLELLWNAHNLQSGHIREKQADGVGIYRLGHEKKMPAYYIGGYYDKGGSLHGDE